MGDKCCRFKNKETKKENGGPNHVMTNGTTNGDQNGTSIVKYSKLDQNGTSDGNLKLNQNGMSNGDQNGHINGNGYHSPLMKVCFYNPYNNTAMKTYFKK